MIDIDIIIVGSGNAALCAAIAALEKKQKVLVLEVAPENEMGGNSRYTAGAMRFAYNSKEDIMPLLKNLDDERLKNTEFGTYTKQKFIEDLQFFNQDIAITELQQFLVDESLSAVQWLAKHNVKFEPSYARQSYKKNDKHIFWGGLAVDIQGEGDGMVQLEMKEFLSIGGNIKYNCEVTKILYKENKVIGVECVENGEPKTYYSKAVVLACGGFEANQDLRKKYLGQKWKQVKVRGTQYNQGKGIDMAVEIGAEINGNFNGCHAVPMDKNMPEYGNLNIPHIERKHYRKISYHLGIMLNKHGKRFVDEGINFRNYTYAQFGKAILEQDDNIAFQIFDSKVLPLLYAEYTKHTPTFYEANTIEDLILQLNEIDKKTALTTIAEYNNAVIENIKFEPSIKDQKSTKGLLLNKTNWANKLDTPPYRAYPVTSGITFTYGGLKINTNAEVINKDGNKINGLFACGEVVGGIFFYGYPGGSGLTSGTVYGKQAGFNASLYSNQLN